MNAIFRPRVLAAALALAAAPALAHETTVITTTPEPVYYESLSRYYYAEPETVATEPATTYYVVPTTTVVEAEPPIVVYGDRADDDVLITNEVMASIASDPAISGRIGVETLNREVRLTGRVGTPGQVDRAGQHAWATDGVDDVHNLLRPRVGG